MKFFLLKSWLCLKQHVVIGAVVKNPPASAGDARDVGSIPGLGRFLEKEMATHSSIFCIPEHVSVVVVIPPFSDLVAL